MSKVQLKWLSCCLGACMVAGSVLAQAGTTPPSTTYTHDKDSVSSKTTGTTTSSGQFLRSKDLVGAKVKDSQGEKVGDIQEVYLNPRNGVAFAAIDISGSRHAVVPLQALTVTSSGGIMRSYEIAVNKTKAELHSGPTIAGNEWQKLDDPSFSQQIFSHYNMRPPAAMGGAEPPEGSATDKSDTSTQPLTK